MDESLRQALDRVRENPGCYLYKDAQGTVLYVGKAVNLRRRVFQYFQERADLGPKNRLLVAQIRSLETLVVGTEMEALVLEENLIKRFRPRFNVLLRDDKRYPYLQLTLGEAYPRLLVTRRPHLNSGDRYFGPFVHVGAMREVLRLVHRHLGLRQCSIEIDRRLERPCLYYDLHQCEAPCVAWGETQERYAEHAEQVRLLLEGREDGLLTELARRMQEASDAERFEEAARFRDGLKAVDRVRERQRVVLAQPRDVDVVALARVEDSVGVKVFFVRGGKLVDWQDCRLANAETAEPSEILAAFVKQFYSGVSAVPPEVLLSNAVEDSGELAAWLASRRGAKVELLAPRRGEKMALVRLCEANAQKMLQDEGLQPRRFGERREARAKPAAAHDIDGGLEELRKLLDLPGPPLRIDGFDISHFQGSQTVASMVVVEAGRPARGQYRKFKIRSVDGVDDFASMEEVVTRRYRRVDAEGGPWPDLIVIDGGKGQLGAALKALRALGLQRLAVIGLAKRFEEIFVPGKVESLRLDERSPGRLLIQRLRDEAHRFAITFHRSVRAKALVHSALDDVAGVGPAMKKRLLRAFGSASAVFAASLEDLCAVEGVGPTLARRLKLGAQGPGTP